MLELIGWAGAVCFAISAAPQAWMSFRQGHSQGLSVGLLFLWFSGESLSLIYGAAKSLPLPVMFNYALNFAFLCVIIYYKLFPRRNV